MTDVVTYRTGAPPLRLARVGAAWLVYGADAPDPRANAFTGGLAADESNLLVVADLPADADPADWDAVAAVIAGALADTGRAGAAGTPATTSSAGVRLIPGRVPTVGAVAVGRRVAGILDRPVVVADGMVQPAAGGQLFIPAARGEGWTVCEPGREPRHDSRRFPKPTWERAVRGESWPLGNGAVAEPLPSGVWLRPDTTRMPADGLVTDVLADPECLLVALGSPGAKELPLSAIVSFWRGVPSDLRSVVRFVACGPVTLAGQPSVGQALADLTNQPVVLGTGLPVVDRSTGRPETRAVRVDGSLGWSMFATSLGYRPGRNPGGIVYAPRVLDSRVPAAGLEPSAPGVYAYGGDAIVEIVHSGLLVHARPGPPDAALDAARLAPLHPDHPVVFVDASGGERVRRAADQVVRRLEPALRDVCIVETVGTRSPAAVPTSSSPPDVASTALAIPVPPVATVLPVATVPPAVPVPPVATALPVVRPTLVSGPPDPVAGAPVALASVAERDAEAAAPGASAPAGRTVPAVSAMTPEPDPAGGGTTGEAPAPGGGTPMAAPTRADAGGPVTPAGPRVQPVPDPAVSAVPPDRGIDEERLELRRHRSGDFETSASVVIRLLSQSPGLRAGAGTAGLDVVTDLAAVHLYLTDDGTVDRAVRRGAAGPYVAWARCVAMGLRRLPSYRGATALRVTLDEAEWAWYGERDVIVDWGFAASRAGGPPAGVGDVDVLIWSMTGRRTALLHSEPADLVLFLPGSTFRVLETRDGDKRVVLLRELVAAESGGQPAQLDQLALTGLRRAESGWPESRVDDGTTRFRNPPGLLGPQG